VTDNKTFLKVRYIYKTSRDTDYTVKKRKKK